MLTEALAGRSGVDAGWWAELDRPATSVATDATGAVLGVISYALRPKDTHGVILWLHCHENQTVARTLLHHAATQLAPRPLEAFQFASALTLGLEALPVRHRPATHAARGREAGVTFTAESFVGRVLAVVSRRSPGFRPPRPPSRPSRPTSASAPGQESSGVQEPAPAGPDRSHPPVPTQPTLTELMAQGKSAPATWRLIHRGHLLAAAAAMKTAADTTVDLDGRRESVRWTSSSECQWRCLSDLVIGTDG
ncbi:hypothetical protein GCM10010260_83060 [Streptomyces filipinensis]|uniref:Uncharacterized protein n=1 Tax=Streptomyces filipinensis TaxID=66887 RepID=A0A918MGF8_9ACTN|nr:hypothetical protein [Streptomyces filipinensis]GGV29900.1 hypothetical protein GCM10010260_83060 [Streptomyces filipinensis]